MGMLSKLRATIMVIIAMTTLTCFKWSASADSPKQTASDWVGSEKSTTHHIKPVAMEITPVAEMENGATAPETEEVVDPILKYDLWVEERVSKINAVDVNYVMSHNTTFASHEVTAIANHIDVNNDGVPDINYVHRFPGAKNLVISSGFLMGIGVDNGWVFGSGQHIETGLAWNMLPACVEVEMIDGTFETHTLEAGTLVAVGLVVTHDNDSPYATNAGAGDGTHTSDWCEITCDPGFWACCNKEPQSCKCVRNTVANPNCDHGGTGARTCLVGTRPSTSNRDDFNERPRYQPQTPN